MTSRTLVVLALALSACRPQVMPRPQVDAGPDEEVIFDGPTSNTGIPQLPEDFAFDASIPRIDSGVIVVDTTCCVTTFSIADREPAEGVVGGLYINLSTFDGGVPLTRAAGRWTTTACFPVNQSASYQYQFDYDGGVIDAGIVELEDGGLVHVERLDLQTWRRGSDEEPGFELADGTRTNFYRAVSSCDGLDGGVPQ